MQFFKLMFIFLFFMFTMSCTRLPTGKVSLKDANGNPIITEISVKSSSHVLLSHIDSALLLENMHSLSGKTNEKGEFAFQYMVAKKPSWLKRVFGSKKIPNQHLTVSYSGTNKNSNQLTFEVNLR